MTKQSEIELSNLSDDVIKLHDNRELMRLASLVGTDAKTPELKLAKYVASLIDTACVEAVEKQRKAINSAMTQGIVGVSDDIVIIHATKDLIETLLGELALDTRINQLKGKP